MPQNIEKAEHLKSYKHFYNKNDHSVSYYES